LVNALLMAIPISPTHIRPGDFQVITFTTLAVASNDTKLDIYVI